ncbi:DUF6680 family protein [Devosia sp.]|uniref:DUF6680 family protein n=1 Tax=Devosia sp. TaxID=1871048 RepID=UPI002FC7EF7B
MTAYETLNVWILVVTVAAIIAGPIAAVVVTRWGDGRRETRRRKSEILSALMKTRPMRLSFEHVAALNLIQLEFHGENEIQAAYGNYVAHLNQEMPKEGVALDKFVELRADLFIELLHSIGKHLGFGFDKRDLAKLSYGPVGWENDENSIRMLRSLSVDVLTGRQALSVIMRPSAAPSTMFPPPPEVQSDPAG